MSIRTKRINENEILIPRQNDMQVDATIFASDDIQIEETAIKQLADGASMKPAKRVLATPDIHQGYGVPIGSVIGLEGAVCPAAVGYDINCGMRMLRTDMQAEEVNFDRLLPAIRNYIPLGEGKSNVSLSPSNLARVLAEGVKALPGLGLSNHPVWDMVDKENTEIDCHRMEDQGSLPGDPEAVSKQAVKRGRSQLATLGGGNHFIEFQVVESILDQRIAERFGLFPGQLVFMVHSGSRGFGHQVGGEAMKTAKKAMPGQQVPWLDMDSTEGKQYWGAMNAAANYAFVNRHLMGLLTGRALVETFNTERPALVYDVPHNIAKLEKHREGTLCVHRKGATRAFGPRRMAGTSFGDTGQPVLIPGSMGTASYLLAGVDGNQNSMESVNHGAGRVMSRSQARGKFKGRREVKPAAITDQQFEEAMQGVQLICENRWTIKEEAPQAYKDIDVVIAIVAAANLCTVVARMRPLAVLKG